MEQLVSAFGYFVRGIERASTLSKIAKPTGVVYVVDDDASVRQSLALLIEAAGWQSQTFATATDFLAQARTPGPSCLVLDVVLPGLDGLGLQEKIGADRPDTPIIFITGHGDVPMTVQAMKGGALEVLTKPFDDSLLLDAIGGALARSRTALDDEAARRLLRDRHASLTARECEVMALVIDGLLNKQIAAQLGISEITVKAHRGKVMRKMKAGSLAHLVRMAARLDVDGRPDYATVFGPASGPSTGDRQTDYGLRATSRWGGGSAVVIG